MTASEACKLTIERHRKKEDDAALKGEKGFDKRDEAWKQMSARFDPFAGKADDVHEKKVECYLDQKNTLQVPHVLGYKGRTKGFPEPSSAPTMAAMACRSVSAAVA